ncbi:hypothetical protein ABZX98_31075 [Streptomyces sp. NPDC002992]|uniref:hypothetical protein n=1 Tax=Streptomyces sp. NPDC002992 TaxID=3154273 RepID=UPI0033AF6106
MLELAGIESRDTTDPERATELLVLQGVYEDTRPGPVCASAPPPHPPTARPAAPAGSQRSGT